MTFWYLYSQAKVCCGQLIEFVLIITCLVIISNTKIYCLNYEANYLDSRTAKLIRGTFTATQFDVPDPKHRVKTRADCTLYIASHRKRGKFKILKHIWQTTGEWEWYLRMSIALAYSLLCRCRRCWDISSQPGTWYMLCSPQQHMFQRGRISLEQCWTKKYNIL